MRVISLFALTMLGATPAMAADAVLADPQPMAEMATVGDWTGFYAGVQLGGAFGGDSGIFSMDRNGDGAFGDYLPAFDPTQPVCAGDGCGFAGDFESGITGGIHAGYDWQFGNIVAGALVDINAMDIGDRQSGFSGTPAFYHIDRDLDYLVTARAKLGYAFSDRLMAYATGGLAVGDVKYSFVSNTPAASVVTGGGDTDVGYSVGGGVTAKVTQKVSLGVEYLYTNLGDDDFNVNLSGPAAFSGPGSAGSTNARGSDGDFDFHTVQLKVSYHF